MTDIDLDAIRAREQAATPGPWQMLVGNSWAGEVVVATEGGHPLALVSTAKDDTAAQADAEFIAHARTDVPALIAAVQRRDDALAAVLALFDTDWWPEERPWGHHDHPDASYLAGQRYAEALVRAAITAHAPDVPMSPNKGHADTPTTEDR